MKVIDKALLEVEYFPRAGWWGWKDGEFNYLMRYGHIMMVWKPREILYKFHETITDKIGVEYAEKVIMSMQSHFSIF
jgi:hypothetical protein